MATTVNDPSNPKTGGAPVQNAPEQNRPDATPTSNNDGVKYTAATYKVSASGDTKVTGTAGDDRVSTKDLIADSDKVIKLGAGDDVFIFRQDDSTNSSLRNAVVDLGEGSRDQIVLANEISDYQITFRDNGSIKFEYVGNLLTAANTGAAITFQGAELFTFRNISDNGDGKFYDSRTYTLDQLRAEFGLGPQNSESSVAHDNAHHI